MEDAKRLLVEYIRSCNHGITVRDEDGKIVEVALFRYFPTEADWDKVKQNWLEDDPQEQYDFSISTNVEIEWMKSRNGG